MARRPVVVLLEEGPASYAALRTAADQAARAGAPLEGFVLVEEGRARARVFRRFRLALDRRGLEGECRLALSTDLAEAAARHAQGAAILCVARAPRGRLPGLCRRLALARVLRGAGCPLLVTSGASGRSLQRVLIAHGGEPDAGARLLQLLEAGWRTRGRARPAFEHVLLPDTAEADAGELEGSVLGAAERTRPGVIALEVPVEGSALGALLAPGVADRLVARSTWTLLVGRRPETVSVPVVAPPSRERRLARAGAPETAVSVPVVARGGGRSAGDPPRPFVYRRAS